MKSAVAGPIAPSIVITLTRFAAQPGSAHINSPARHSGNNNFINKLKPAYAGSKMMSV